MKNENPNFFDARTIIAVVLVALTFVGWQSYMQKKYPEAFNKKKAATTQPAVTQDKKVADEKNPGATNPPATVTEAPVQTTAEEKLTDFENDNMSFSISSRGMGLKNFHVRKYKDRKGEVVQLGPDQRVTLETRLLGHTEPLDFTVQKISDNTFVGRARVGTMEITKTLEVIPDNYVIDFKISTKGSDDRFVGLTTAIADRVEKVEHPPGFFQRMLGGRGEIQEFYIVTSDTDDRVQIPEADVQKAWAKVKVASLGWHYFAQAIVDQSPIMPEAKASSSHATGMAEVLMLYPILNRGEGLDLKYSAYMGPKSHHLLSQVDPALGKVVNFGFFNWIGRQILSLLKWFYAMVGNWGFAIVLLTVLVRILVLPFNVYSYKSMKAMQDIQPKIQAVREKYKDDQAKQQQEIMVLMRENKVNPVGGCLPMFFQFPIFIALYQVLGNSIELYQAPFMLWIHDLSLKDPYYILPVLMGVTMFIQQKITPNRMDPAQAKVLLMMPLIFSFIMFSLPSGLTLYMFVGAVFSVLQQLYFMRDSRRKA